MSLSTGALRAQDAPALAVRGAVVTDNGERVPHALVSLTPGYPQQFAAADGRFAFTGLRPGAYRLSVRQVGFRPFDTTVTVEGVPIGMRVELRRIAVPLRALTLGTDAPCTTPGPPDRAADPVLADLFDQLIENAARSLMLSESYPHRFYVARRFFDEMEDGSNRLRRRDTLEFRSDDRWRYRPGRVVTWGSGRSRLVHLPELPELADPEFQRTHCFSGGGTDSVGGRALIRLDFKVAESVRSPDINGSAWLDPSRYQLRRLRVELTRAGSAIRGARSLSATVTFREEFPYIAIMEGLLALTIYRDAAAGIVAVSEEQTLVRVEFERTPGETPQ